MNGYMNIIYSEWSQSIAFLILRRHNEVEVIRNVTNYK